MLETFVTGLSYRYHKVRRGVARYGVVRTARGLRRMLDFRLRRPAEGVIRTHRDGLVIHFLYPRQYMPTLALFGELVEPEYQLLRRILTPRSVVFDVGGGIGTYALTAACRGVQAVHVFEPTSEGHAAIVRNLAANNLARGNVVINRMAVSNRRGTLVMERRESLFVGGVSADDSRRARGETVATITLDEYCRERDIDHIDVLKVDVEGHETQVVDGASELISRRAIDVLILEVDPACAALYQSIAAAGYSAYFYDDDRHALLPVRPLTEARIEALKPTGFHCNLVMARDDTLTDIDHVTVIR